MLAQDVAGLPRCLEEVDVWLVDSLVVPASLHDTQGRFVHMNAAAERACGKSNAEMVGRTYTALLPPEAHANVTAQFRRALCGEPTDFETIFVDASGHVRGVRAQQLPLRDGDAVVGLLILAFDVQQPPPDPIGHEPRPHLTPRQREILELIAAGVSTSEIARRLTLSTETVRNHLRGVFRELDVHTRPEAIAAARRLGLLAAPGLRPLRPDAGVQTR